MLAHCYVYGTISCLKLAESFRVRFSQENRERDQIIIWKTADKKENAEIYKKIPGQAEAA